MAGAIGGGRLGPPAAEPKARNGFAILPSYVSHAIRGASPHRVEAGGSSIGESQNRYLPDLEGFSHLEPMGAHARAGFSGIFLSGPIPEGSRSAVGRSPLFAPAFIQNFSNLKVESWALCIEVFSSPQLANRASYLP
jgi:hypothetical protein